jgi:uncharacterized radical SAM protein YgiQ
MEERGWEECDFIFVTGDAYVDHPSFAAAIISRVLEADGFRVGILVQPDWKVPASYTILGRPRLGFLVGAGNMDSMVAHYTAAKKKRSEDAYTPGGKAGARPDRALLKYVGGIRAAFDNAAIIIGGIEASLRRFAHYDYWSDTVRRSILLDSKADILVYGMGESAIREIAKRLESGKKINEINDIRGTCVRSNSCPADVLELPGYETIKTRDTASLRLYAEHFMIKKMNADPLTAKTLAEKNDGGRWVIQNPPAFPLEQKEFDRIYELPFTRRSHPVYDAVGGIPALKEVSFSLVSSRGCSGGCSFCSIAFLQGKAIRGRSKESLVREAKALTAMPGFKGYIHDVGGPTANFYTPLCDKQKKGGFCIDRECLFPSPCPNINPDHRPYLDTLKALRQIEGVKKVFIRSGLRFDFIEADREKGGEFLETLCKYHVSGQLKIAPEHSSPRVLATMGKAGDYESFRRKFTDTNKKLNMKQYLLPYFISGHPGCGLEDAIELALYLKKSGFVPDQIQDFYPTPGTLSTAMYYTGLDPRTMEAIHVPKEREKKLQKALLHFDKKENYVLVKEALKTAGREDLLNRI